MTDPYTFPLSFSGDMVRALLDGRKTQARLLSPARPRRAMAALESGRPVYAWVREATTRFDRGTCDQWIWYRAGGNDNPRMVQIAGGPDAEWPKGVEGPGAGAAYNVAPIHMPRWASRLTLVVEDMEVKRLQGISANDAYAEGVVRGSDGYIASFYKLWNSQHPKDPWSSDPLVAVTRFRTVLQNIDTVLAA